jgi:hypothetical protein
MDLYKSGIGTFFAEMVTMPISTIKTLYQTREPKLPLKAIVTHVYSNVGVKGFFKASIPAVSSQILACSSKYYLYRYYERQLVGSFEEHTDIKYKMVCGLLSGITATMITHPIDFCKIKLQSSLHDKNNGISQEIKNNGIKVIYRGYSKTFFKASIGSMLFLPLNDTLKLYTDNIVYASMCSAIISAIILQPLDYLQIRHLNGNTHLHDGLKYYRGLHLNLLRVVPHFTITMTIIDQLG